MSATLGRRFWMIPDCYWPEVTGEGRYASHESICVLNAGDSDARLTLTLYFEDREPMEGFVADCAARRTHHVRMDKLVSGSGEPVPKGVPYAALVESSVPVAVQYSRIDTTQPNETLATTLAYPI